MSRKIYIFLIYFSTGLIVKEVTGIIRGEPATIFDWPSLVLIKYYSGHFCGGTLFFQHWVMTAAQCIDPKIVGTSIIEGVGLGFYDLGSSDTGNIVPIVFLKIHPSFAALSGKTINDIALIRIPTSTPMTPTVHPIPLTNKERIPINSSCKTAGWGMSSIDIYIRNVTPQEVFHRDRVLFEIDQIIVDIKECKRASKGGKIDITEGTHICARSSLEKAGPTFGDIGGPLICSNEQVGISSFAIYNPQKSSFLYMVYTPIGRHRIWAERIVSSNPEGPVIRRADTGTITHENKKVETRRSRKYRKLYRRRPAENSGAQSIIFIQMFNLYSTVIYFIMYIYKF